MIASTIPENCYHLELQWLNVTSKLVDDAIMSWTTQAEKYGLKLVELPIAEASKVPLQEPFRAYYRISLALEPPQRSSGSVSFTTVFFTATSFTPQVTPPNADVHVYQKALLKRFNFVLDLEAVSEFPENVEIRYSWGRLDYRYTQFVHRSGVVLAQITDTGDILLLANRLYNSRLAGGKEERSRFDNLKKEGTPNASKEVLLLRPQPTPNQTQNNATATFGPTSMSASGIIALNVASPRSGPFASPLVKPINTAMSPLNNININPQWSILVILLNYTSHSGHHSGCHIRRHHRRRIRLAPRTDRIWLLALRDARADQRRPRDILQ